MEMVVLIYIQEKLIFSTLNCSGRFNTNALYQGLVYNRRSFDKDRLTCQILNRIFALLYDSSSWPLRRPVGQNQSLVNLGSKVKLIQGKRISKRAVKSDV